jgi:hypothetical protein
MTPQDNPGYVLVSRELAEYAASKLTNDVAADRFRTAPTGYSREDMEAAVEWGMLKQLEGGYVIAAFDLWLTEHLKGGSTS